jgi:RimJ/RimL family protein N-acetyltransferase
MSAAEGGLVVRPPAATDLGEVFRVHGDPRTNVHNPAGPDRDLAASAARLQGWLDHWRRHGFGYWVVERAGAVVGFGGVQRSTWLERPVLDLYYRVDADHWGRGYATEVARRALAWARRAEPATPVVAYTTEDDAGSQRTAIAAGLVRRPDLEHELDGLHAVVLADRWPA